METRNILKESDHELLKKYPLYSQDGTKGEALALMRLYITGTTATFYVLEGNPTEEGAEDWQFFGLTNMGQDGWEYGYFTLGELLGINLQGGLLHIAKDNTFTPTRLKDMPDVADVLADLWAM